jgi:hypothetical protein
MKLQLKLWSRVLYILIIENLNVYYYIPEKKITSYTLETISFSFLLRER